MTVEAVTRKAGPYVCQPGGVYPFYFKVFSASDVYVVLAENGIEATADFGTDYVVRLNANQDNEPGGVVELLCEAAGKSVTIGSCVPYTQEVVITNKGGFYPTILNKAYDKLTILVQQLLEEVSRCVKVPISGQEKPDTLVQTLYESALTARESAAASAASAAQSGESAEEAYKWANMPEDEAVPSDAHPGEYSAYHHAQKAGQKTEEAAASATASAASAEAAYRWANTAEEALVQTGGHVGYSAYHYAQKAKANADAAASAIMPGSLVGQLFYGQIVLSAVPIESDGLCLLNGQQFQKGGRYDKFINHIAGLKEDHPGLFVTETAWWATVWEYGSCGKFVLGEDSIRLPKISDILECTTDMDACGNLVEAGLPNITGNNYITGFTSIENEGAGALYASGQFAPNSGIPLISSDGIVQSHTGFDASRSNPIYGASDTVQPQTLKALAYIVVDAVDVDALNELLKTVNEKGETGQVLVKGENGAAWQTPGGFKNTINCVSDLTLTAKDINSVIIRTKDGGNITLPPLSSVPRGSEFVFYSGNAPAGTPTHVISTHNNEIILTRGTSRTELPFINGVYWHLVAHDNFWILENSEIGGFYRSFTPVRNVWYTNNRPQPIVVSLNVITTSSGQNYCNLLTRIAGKQVLHNQLDSGTGGVAMCVSAIVPPGGEYCVGFDPSRAAFNACFLLYF